MFGIYLRKTLLNVDVISLKKMLKLSVVHKISVPAELCDVKMEIAGRGLPWFSMKGACKSPPEGVIVFVGLSVGKPTDLFVPTAICLQL